MFPTFPYGYVGGMPQIVLDIPSSTADYVAFTEAGSPAGPVRLVLTVDASATHGGTLDVTGFNPLSQVFITNDGNLYGRGGNGGDAQAGAAGGAGTTGTSALALDAYSRTDVTNNGEIRGGGGGGGGGGAGDNEPTSIAGGGGGGGGRGYGTSTGGIKGPGSSPPTTEGTDGTDGSTAGAGAGGAGGTGAGSTGGNGGAGGDWATAGVAGGNGSPATGGGSGGNAGSAITGGGAALTYTDNGTTSGAVA